MKKTILAFLTMLLFVACKNENAKSSDEMVTLNRKSENQLSTTKQEEAQKEPAPQYINDEKDKQQQNSNSKQAQQQVPVSNQDWDKKIIKTASINLEIKDFKTYNSTFRDKIRQVGGYIAQEQQSETEYKIENTLSIKVPIDKFDEAVQLLTKDAEKLNEKRISSEDVTMEFVDTRSRLEAKKQVRLRYLDLLKQAKNMEEILNVQSEINGIQEEIESASGRIEYFSHSSSFSTINLTFYQILNPLVADPAKPSFSSKFSAAFREGWNWIQEVVIILVTLWPLVLAVVGIYVVYHRARKPKIKQV